jgi:hypothetical protein
MNRNTMSYLQKLDHKPANPNQNVVEPAAKIQENYEDLGT